MVTPVIRSAALLSALGAGWIAAWQLGLRDVDQSPWYGFFITALLGFGLYASTSGIVISEFRKQFRTVVLAVTLGVLAKVALIFGVMFFVFRDPNHLILAVAVAQIDPLSVAAMRVKSKMSDSAKALLSAWASFDDPITVLLTVYITAFALQGGAVGGVGSFAVNLVLNLALAGVAFMVWTLVRGPVRRAELGGRLVRYSVRAVMVVAVLAIGFVAVQYALLLALALLGLFFRPNLGRCVDGLAEVGMFLAIAAVGLVLAAEFTWALALVGVVLGVAAFGSQAVVAFVLTVPKRWRGDRMRLALGQQNGLTAIILALLLEPTFPGSIAVVAPAVVVVNLLNAVTNGVYDRLRPPRPEPVREAEREVKRKPQVREQPATVPPLAAFRRVNPTP